jgi:metal transporter CNNM
MIELIGEEIYDEFDDQGAHGDPYEVPPAIQPAEQDQVDAGTHHTTETSRPSSVNQRSTPGGSNHGHGQKIASQLPTALKGIGFFRTRSAPPVPRDADDADVLATNAVPAPYVEKTVRISESANQERRPASAGAGTGIWMPRPIRGIGRPAPSIILEQHSTVSSSDSGVGAALQPVPIAQPTPVKATLAPAPSAGDARQGVGAGVVSGMGLSGSAGNTPKIPSRTASPAPSTPTPALEAVLLDRKRRLAAAGVHSASSTPGIVHVASQANNAGAIASPAPGAGGGVGGLSLSIPMSLSASKEASPTASSAASVGGAGAVVKGATPAKGTRFKSSPLGGGERAGVVVAEQVNAAYSKDGAGDEEQK